MQENQGKPVIEKSGRGSEIHNNAAAAEGQQLVHCHKLVTVLTAVVWVTKQLYNQQEVSYE